jgi:cell division protein ZapE
MTSPGIRPAKNEVRLVDRHPRLGAGELIPRFVPPARFGAVRFESYLPNPEHPSQTAALVEVERLAADLCESSAPEARRWFRRRNGQDAANDRPAALYLDGGYGVGKTHLVAALWHAVPPPAAYLTFAELTAVIGFLGMEAAVDAFRGYRLLCIDEFELDDVANTLMAVSFLRAVLPDTKVATTSNSLPDRLGEGRFHADDFRREIAAIAAHFEVVRIDGPDYRGKSVPSVEAMDDPVLESVVAAAEGPVAVDHFDPLLDHLRQVHPVQFPALLDGLDVVAIRGLHPIRNQGDALLFVHLVDELYDAGLTVVASGCAIGDLFPETYRHGGYRKKYGRAESRLAALLAEATAVPRK